MRPAVALMTALMLSASASAAQVARRAVVVGANDGGVELEPLQYAELDASRVSVVLAELGGFSEGEITVLESPGYAELQALLAELAAEEPAEGDSLFLFYYSGHADARGLRLGGDVMEYQELKDSIRAVPADVHLGILDACRSGAITRVKGASVAEPFLDHATLAAEGEAWIAASSEHEDAQESDRLQGSFFTHYLVSGLRGAADSGDGRVSLNEAYSYAYERTVARTVGTLGGTQHPAYEFRIQGNGDLDLTDVRRATAHITLPVDQAGEVAVLRQPEGTPVAEIAKVAGQEVRLALPPGRYVLRRRVDGQLQQVVVHLGEGSSLTVDRWGDARQEVASRKGGLERNPWEIPVGEVEQQIHDQLDLLRAHLPRISLRRKPGIAGVASALLPGSGQAYSGRWGEGLLFFSAFAVLNGGGWVASAFDNGGGLSAGAVTGPTPWTLAGLAVYGWSIADATYGVHRREAFRPRRGTTVSLETAWWDDPDVPHASGVSVDYVFAPGFSVGLDRLGFLNTPEGMGVFAVGARMTAGIEGARLRPAVLVAADNRTYFPVRDEVEADVRSTLVLGAGGNLRWYVTPRYFLQVESRVEWEGGQVALTGGGGLGLHIGGGRALRDDG